MTALALDDQALGRVDGRLHLRFRHDSAEDGTVMELRAQQPPLRVVRAFPMRKGGALVHLHNLSGGILGGDRLGVQVEIGPTARAQLTTTGATRIYRARDGSLPAVQTTEIRVAEGGVLESLPDPIIPFAGSRYRQETRIDLAAGAGFFGWETVTSGREAFGERFAYDLLNLKLDLTVEGRPIARERIHLEPHLRPLPSPTRLGPYLAFTTFYICKVGETAAVWTDLESRLNEQSEEMSRPGEILWAASALPAHGLVVRGLSGSGKAIAPGLLEFWRTAKRALYREEIEPPRKVY